MIIHDEVDKEIAKLQCRLVELKRIARGDVVIHRDGTEFSVKRESDMGEGEYLCTAGGTSVSLVDDALFEFLQTQRGRERLEHWLLQEEGD